MAVRDQIGKDIVAALRRLAGVSVRGKLGRPAELPRIIALGNGQSLQITPNIDELIARLAQQLRTENPAHAKTVRDEEWRGWVRSAVGPAFVSSDPKHTAAVVGKALATAVKTSVEQELAGLPDREHAFGASVFSDVTIDPFSIGPVRIEPRAVWLIRKVAEGFISRVTQRRLEALWSGQRLRKRKRGFEMSQERDILAAVDGAPYVVSVTVSGFAGAASLEAAATAARAALTCIALLWRNSAYVMQGLRLRYDPGVRSQTALTFVKGQRHLAGWRILGDRFGPPVTQATWTRTLASAADMLAAAGEALGFLVSPDGKGPRPAVMSSLAQAILLFCAGCREENGAMAMVAFGACLDALAGGGGDTAILKLFAKRFLIAPTTTINKHSTMTFQAAVREIYGAGRSQTIHGTSDRVGADWSGPLDRAQQFARLTLLECLAVVGHDTTITETVQLRT